MDTVRLKSTNKEWVLPSLKWQYHLQSIRATKYQQKIRSTKKNKPTPKKSKVPTKQEDIEISIPESACAMVSIHKPNKSFDHDQVIRLFEIQKEHLSEKDYKTIEKLIPFYNRILENYNDYGHKKKKYGVHPFDEGSNLWAYEDNGYLFFFAKIGYEYFGYDLFDGRLRFICCENSKERLISRLSKEALDF